jgi:hypothetical protein
VETGVLNERAVVPAVVDEQAKKIMEEAQRAAENKLKEALPALPHPPVESPRAKVAQRRFSEEDLLNYLSTTNGFVDVDYVSKTYGVEKEYFVTLLRVLAQKGVIALEE